MRIASIQKRADFLRISDECRKCAVPSCLLLEAPHPQNTRVHADIRLGLTVTKKLGNAVTRNRIRRRLREAFQQAAPEHARSGHDYVLIARKNALLCEFATLIGELQSALRRVKNAPLPQASHRKTLP